MEVIKLVPKFRNLVLKVSLKNLNLADYQNFLVLWRQIII